MKDEDDWTHEAQNIYEDLGRGDGDSLIKHLLEGKTIPDTLKQHISFNMQNNDFKFTFFKSNVKAGRPKAKKAQISKSIIWYWSKKYLCENYGLNKGEAERHIARVFATNFTYVTDGVRQGKNFLKLLEKEGLAYIPPTKEEIADKYPELFRDL